MFGYAMDETEECMPLTILLAHKLNYRMRELSRNGECPWILPDSKSQVIKPQQQKMEVVHDIPHLSLISFCIIKALKCFKILLYLHLYRLWSNQGPLRDFYFVFLQVTVEYRDNNGAMEPLRVHTVVLSVQHSPDITLQDIRHHLMEKVVKVVIPAKYLDDKTIYHLLPSGKFLMGGPQVSENLR